MGRMKNFLLENQREDDELWESYLEWCEDNKDLFQQLPKNIQQDLMEGDYE